MPNSQTLSVLLPNYNNAPYLQECLESVLNQTFTDFTIFLVDDASTDNSIEVINSIKDDRIVLIKKEQNSGIVDTMNVALKEIQSKYFIRMDGDDIIDKNRFKILVQFMEENGEIDVCGSAIETFGLHKKLMTYSDDPLLNKANLLFGHSIGHASCIFRTATLKENNIQYVDDFFRLEDYQLFYNLKAVATTTSIPDKLYFYRQGEYNNNPEIEKKKLAAYGDFYKMVLTELLDEVSTKEVTVHLELAKKMDPSHSLEQYASHESKILEANRSKGIYPQKELEEVLDKRMRQLKFKLVDAKQLSMMKVLGLGMSDFSLIKHYFKKKLK